MIANPYSGKFIVFEGIDGSGHTTQSRLLAEHLKQERKNGIILTEEPTRQGEVGELLDKVLCKKVSLLNRTTQLLFAADRSEHHEKIIRPALQQGQWVVCDRYVFSSIAYGGASGLSEDWIALVNERFIGPDMTFILIVPIKVALDRIAQRDNPQELFEKEGVLARTQHVYEQMVERYPGRTRLIVDSGEQSIEQIHQQAAKDIKGNFI